MNNWRLFLFTCLAVFQPIASFTERNLVNGRQQCCERDSHSLFRDRRLSTHEDYRTYKPIPESRRLNSRDEFRVDLRSDSSLLRRVVIEKDSYKRERDLKTSSKDDGQRYRVNHQQRHAGVRFAKENTQIIVKKDETQREISRNRLYRNSHIREDNRNLREAVRRENRIERHFGNTRTEIRKPRESVNEIQRNDISRDIRNVIKRDRDNEEQRKSERRYRNSLERNSMKATSEYQTDRRSPQQREREIFNRIRSLSLDDRVHNRDSFRARDSLSRNRNQRLFEQTRKDSSERFANRVARSEATMNRLETRETTSRNRQSIRENNLQTLGDIRSEIVIDNSEVTSNRRVPSELRQMRITERRESFLERENSRNRDRSFSNLGNNLRSRSGTQRQEIRNAYQNVRLQANNENRRIADNSRRNSLERRDSERVLESHRGETRNGVEIHSSVGDDMTRIARTVRVSEESRKSRVTLMDRVRSVENREERRVSDTLRREYRRTNENTLSGAHLSENREIRRVSTIRQDGTRRMAADNIRLPEKRNTMHRGSRVGYQSVTNAFRKQEEKTKEDKYTTGSSPFNWQYLLYTLQAIYLGSIFVQMIGEKTNDKKKNSAITWWTSRHSIKID